MKHIYKIMTLNINGITSDTKIGMLATMLRQKEIDIAMIQEVTTHKLYTIPGYTSYINEVSEKKGNSNNTKRRTPNYKHKEASHWTRHRGKH
jgi:exonuclease III